MYQFHLLALALVFALAQNTLAFECPRDQKVVQGLNKRWKTHKWVSRKFYAEFPDVAAGSPVGVIFSWHGVGDKIETWRKSFALANYSSNNFPFIVITPEDKGLTPIGIRRGVGWDILKSSPGDNNLEAKLFEGVLGCLAKTHNISMNHIYSAGFSGGAIVSSMLHARYPKVIAAIYAGSGAWFNDARQRDLIKIPLGFKLKMQWPELSAEDGGAVLMTYGSEKDASRFARFEILNFHNAGSLSKDFLPRHGRTAVVCEHGSAHYLHPLIDAEEVVKFFSHHSAGDSSPFQTTEDLPRAWRGNCVVVPGFPPSPRSAGRGSG